MRAIKLSFVFLIVRVCLCQAATTYYVATNGDDTRTGLDFWTNALATISNGVFKASASDTVLVSNGTYTVNAAISISKGITVQALSTNRADTLVNGNWPNTTNCCFYLNHANAVLSTFTITNGCQKQGGGVYINAGLMTNCIITGNKATNSSYQAGGGGGVYLVNGTVDTCVISGNIASNFTDMTQFGVGGGLALGGGVVVRSEISSNYADYVAGGVWFQNGSLVTNCVIKYNYARNTQHGITFYLGGKMVNSVTESNGASSSSIYLNKGGVISECRMQGGGFVYLYLGGTVSNSVICNSSVGGITINQYGVSTATGIVDRCIITNNTKGGDRLAAGAGVQLTYGGILRNSLIADNTSTNYGGGVGLLGQTGLVENCTIVGNIASNYGGGVVTEGGVGRQFVNCIIVSNLAGVSGSNWYNISGLACSNCCTYPTNDLPGTGNIAAAPRFAEYPSGNYRLAQGSPCVNAGMNQDWMTNSLDLDDRVRIRYGTVDMGCYEHIFPGMMFSGH